MRFYCADVLIWNTYVKKKRVLQYKKSSLVLCLKRRCFHSTWKHCIAMCGSACGMTARVREESTEQCCYVNTLQKVCMSHSLAAFVDSAHTAGLVTIVILKTVCAIEIHNSCMVNTSNHFKLPPRCKWNLRSSGMLTQRWFITWCGHFGTTYGNFGNY